MFIVQQPRRFQLNHRLVPLMLLAMVMVNAGCATVSSLPRQDAILSTATEAVPAATEIVWFPPTPTKPVTSVSTLVPTPERKPGVGRLITADAMTTSTHWDAATTSEARVTVSPLGLTLSAQGGQPGVVALHKSAVLGDMYMEVTARPSLCREKDAYGLVFRAPNDVAYYRFLAICSGMAAAERVSLGTAHPLQAPTPSADVPPGAPGEVRLGVWALGSEFRFFLNGNYQFTVTDRNYSAGGIGVFAEAGGETPVVVTFSDLQVYALAQGAPLWTATP